MVIMISATMRMTATTCCSRKLAVHFFILERDFEVVLVLISEKALDKDTSSVSIVLAVALAVALAVFLAGFLLLAEDLAEDKDLEGTCWYPAVGISLLCNS